MIEKLNILLNRVLPYNGMGTPWNKEPFFIAEICHSEKV